MRTIGRCPRCGRIAIEILRTHSFCLECCFFPEQWEALETRKSKSETARWIRRDHFHPRGAARFEKTIRGQS